MGWQVSRRTLKSGKKQYRLWTTISDGWLTKWSSREEMLQYLAAHAEYDYKKTVVEFYYRFPHHFGDYDSKKVAIILDDEANKRYSDYNRRFLDAKDCFDFIEEEFKKISQELGL